MFLQDVVALAEALRHEDELDIALEKYSGSQTQEDHAAAYLSEFAFPQAKWVLPFFYLGNIAQPALSKVIPPSILAPPIQSLCSETLTAYSEVRGPLLKHQFLNVKGVHFLNLDDLRAITLLRESIVHSLSHFSETYAKHSG